MGDHRPADGRGRMMAVGRFDVCSNAAVNSDLSCFLYICTAGPTQWRNYGYQLTAADSKRGATGDNYPTHSRPFGNR